MPTTREHEFYRKSSPAMGSGWVCRRTRKFMLCSETVAEELTVPAGATKLIAVYQKNPSKDTFEIDKHGDFVGVDHYIVHYMRALDRRMRRAGYKYVRAEYEV